MKSIKYAFQLIIISLYFISTHSSSTKIPYAKEENGITKKYEDFHPYDITLEFIEPEVNKNSSNNILILKKILQRIQIIISELFLCNSKLEIDYNINLLSRLNIELSQKQKRYFQRKKMITDLLIIVSFEKQMKKNIIISKFFGANGAFASYTYGQRIYMASFRINYDYEIIDKKSEEFFVMNVLQEAFKALGFRFKYLLKSFIKNKFDNVPLYLVENSEIYKSYKKLLYLNDIIINNTEESSTDFYKEFWDYKHLKFHDIMNDMFNPGYTISELTMKVFNEMKHMALPKCDLFKFEQGVEKGFHCLRVTQD